jgi:hypothetical protein
MPQYTVTLTDAEDKALHVVATSAQDWIDNAVHNQCRIAIEQIVAEEVQRKLNEGETISGTKEEIVLAAQVKSAAQVKEEYLAQQVAAEEAARIEANQLQQGQS